MMERYLIQSENVVNMSRRLRKRKEIERIQKERLESERKNILNQICQKRKELMGLTETYENKFGITIGEYLPFGEFLKVLYGI